MFNGMNGLEILKNWPRFEDGEPVAFRDKGLDVHGHARSVEGVKFTQGGFVFISDDMGNTWWANDRGPTENPEIDPDKRVKRSTPKALDADGEEIREGDTVWDTNGRGPFEVTRIVNADRLRVVCDDEENGHLNVYPQSITHRAPVLAADGEPLKVGQRVWFTDSPHEATVERIVPLSDGFSVYLKDDIDEYVGVPPSKLTHQRPVFDADGNRIEPAMDVWWVCEGDERGVHAEKLHVESIGDDGFVTCRPINGGTLVELEPSELYVHKPVLDADGVPIHEGDTVYHVGSGCEYTIRKVLEGGAMIASGHAPAIRCRADYLTHNKPVLDADGAPIKVGDTVWADSGEELTVMGIANLDKGKVGTSGGVYYAESLSHERPVLDADGVPINEGDKLWLVNSFGRPNKEREVSKVCRYDDDITCSIIYFTDGYSTNCGNVTHERPVLDADGVPIMEGDEVYLKHGASAYRVARLPEDDQGRVDIERDGTMWHYMPDQLTHTKPEPPDSWEKFEEKLCYLLDDADMAEHLTERAKSLAGVSE